MQFNKNIENSDDYSIDLDITISKSTLNYIEKISYEYKETILRDLSKNINVPFNELKEQFLVKNKKQPRYYGPDRSQINIDKCMARIWHSKLGEVQCSRHKKDDSDFCKTHQNKQNYGRIDQEFKSKFTY